MADPNRSVLPASLSARATQRMSKLSSGHRYREFRRFDSWTSRCVRAVTRKKKSWEVGLGVYGLQSLRDLMSMGLGLVELAVAGETVEAHLECSKGSQLYHCEASK